MTKPILQAIHIQKSFGQTQVLKSMDFTVYPGEVIALLGPSGSGKTTLLRCLNFLEKADEGRLIFNQREYDLKRVSKQDILEMHQETGFVFQNFNLFANHTALNNIMLSLRIVDHMSKQEAMEKAIELLKKVGLQDQAKLYPSQLSGGQQQRVAIARSLARNPKIIYFDEPTSALDPERMMEVLSVIQQLAKEGRTMIVVTHEMQFAKEVSNRTILMENGVIVEQAQTQDFFTNPRQQRTKEFLKQGK